MAVYESDPNQEPDSAFVPGELRLLVQGSRGRLLDARRTPVTIASVDPSRGSFEVEIGAFEDRGARWELGLDQVTRFQFPRGAPVAAPAAVQVLAEALELFDQELHLGSEPAARARTLVAIATEQRRAQQLLSAERTRRSIDLGAHIEGRRGSAPVAAVLERFLAERGLEDLDRQFAERFVSNPNAGELVKGYAIVLAELGLCPYHGKAARDPELLNTPFSREQRAEHIIARLGFMRALWAMWELDTVTLYRAAATDGPLDASRRSSFIATTFSSAVAEAHFEGGPTTRCAVIWRQRMTTERIFMTFLETAAQSHQFCEAEAILIGDPGNAAF